MPAAQSGTLLTRMPHGSDTWPLQFTREELEELAVERGISFREGKVMTPR